MSLTDSNVAQKTSRKSQGQSQAWGWEGKRTKSHQEKIVCAVHALLLRPDLMLLNSIHAGDFSGWETNWNLKQIKAFNVIFFSF